MPFLLYEYSDKGNEFGFTQSKRLTAVPRLLIRPFVENERQNREVAELRWRMKEEDLVHAVAGELSSKTHAIIIDLKPKVKANVSLYWLKDIWGITEADWTPLCLRLNPLFVDKKEDEPEKFKEGFDVKKEEIGGNVFEFLYLQAGLRTGKWNWGPVGTVNGCLLWRDTFNVFVHEIREYLVQK